MQTTPWYILGAGSIGCLFAAHLHRAGVPVTLLLRDAATAAQWRECGGIELHSGIDNARIAPPALTPAQLTAPVHRVLICTKAHQTQSAVAALRHALAADATLVLLQNGMGVREVLQAALPAAKFLHALTTEGVYQRDRFQLIHAGRGSTAIGAIESGSAALTEQIAASLRCALDIVAVSDIGARLWLKLAINSVINPLTALHECRNGELLQLPGIATQVAALCAELSAVAGASGQPLPAQTLESAVFDVMRSTAANRSSMLRDIELRRRTEIDFISGYVVALARATGTACAHHSALLQAIKEKEIRLGCV